MLATSGRGETRGPVASIPRHATAPNRRKVAARVPRARENRRERASAAAARVPRATSAKAARAMGSRSGAVVRTPLWCSSAGAASNPPAAVPQRIRKGMARAAAYRAAGVQPCSSLPETRDLMPDTLPPPAHSAHRQTDQEAQRRRQAGVVLQPALREREEERDHPEPGQRQPGCNRALPAGAAVLPDDCRGQQQHPGAQPPGERGPREPRGSEVESRGNL